MQRTSAAAVFDDENDSGGDGGGGGAAADFSGSDEGGVGVAATAGDGDDVVMPCFKSTTNLAGLVLLMLQCHVLQMLKQHFYNSL